MAAIASYFHEHGSRADRPLLRAEIAKAIEDSPFLDCGEPWSRPRQDALHYLSAGPGSASNVDGIISYVANRQAETERLAHEVCEPDWPLPVLTAAEAYLQIEAAIRLVIADAAERKRRLRSDLDPWALFESPKRTAIYCSTWTGKTQAMIAGVIEFLRADHTARVAIAVPTHALGEGLASRINEAYLSEVAAEWYGIDRADPLAPGKSMCWLSDTARELIVLGGKLQQLCSRRTTNMHYCTHHPSIAGPDGCGYQRQQTPAVTQRTRVWIVPATMLSLGPPPALGGDFDLLVIDEAPWFNLLQKEPIKIPLEWLSPDWPETHQARASKAQRNSVAETLTKIFLALSALPLSEVRQDLLLNQGISESDLIQTRRTVWRYKVDLRKYVRPGWKLSKLKRELAGVAPHNRRVVGVAQALEILKHHVGGRLAPSGVLITDENNKKYLSLRWRRDIDSAWLKPPILYLDAVDIGTYEIAKAWLPDLAREVEARAKAPHMRIAQLVDSSMAYRKFSALAKEEEGTARNNRDKWANIVASLGLSGLIICPKQLRAAWEKEQSLPPGWAVWNFGAIRGRHEARGLPVLVIVSRPQPSRADVEITAETIFGRRVERIAGAAWYPTQAVGRLLGDGTGRRALSSRHPDPLAEAVRFAICEGEVLQAVGRGRGVQRTAETPLMVWLLTNIPIPIPIDQLFASSTMSDTGPFDALLSRGVIPLDYVGIARALPERFESASKVKNWLEHRPEVRSRLGVIRKIARRSGAVYLCEFCGVSDIESYKGDSAKLAAYSYRKAPGKRQSSLVLVNVGIHSDPRAAVEAVLGVLHSFQLPRRRKPPASVVPWPFS